MVLVKSTLKLSNANKDMVCRFIEHWRENVDLPCKEINLKNIDEKTLLLEIHYPLDIFDKSVTQFSSILFAEIPLVETFGDVTFVDLYLPNEIYGWFTGPKFGSEKIKERFNVKNWPFLLAIVKPSLGTNILQLKNKIEEVLSSKFHAIKDDEMLGNVLYSPLKERIELAQAYRKYIPTLNLDKIEDYNQNLSHGEIGMVLINASTIGFPMLNEIKKNSKVPLCSHMAMQGTFAATFSAKVFAKLHRLFGCDAYILPIGGAGYYSLTKKEEKEMIEEFTKELPIKKTLPIIVGGADPDNVKELAKPYIGFPFGIAFGSFIFSRKKKPSQQCKLVTDELDKFCS